MLMDGDFARRVVDGDGATCATLGLDEEGLSWLRATDLAALSADPEGRRHGQVAGNVAGEFRLGLAACEASGKRAGWLEGFFGSEEFHRAVLDDTRLALAFGRFALGDARARGWDEVGWVLELELGLARLRRESVGGRLGDLAAEPEPHHHPRPPGDRGADPPTPAAVAGIPTETRTDVLRLSRRARCIELPAGTHAWCELLQASLGTGGRVPVPTGFPGPERETVLLFAHEPRGPHLSTGVRADLLRPPVDELLRRAGRGLSRAERAAFARAQGAEPEDLEAFLEGFLDEGVLERAPSSSSA